MGPGTETLTNSYDPAQFQSLAIDVWDGGTNQVNIFAANAEITYPILMFGGGAGIMTDYNCTYDYFFIIGGDGVIRWRGHWDEAVMTSTIDSAIADLATSDVADVPTNAHQLLANYPNPFNPVTRIPYELGATDATAAVRLEVLDIRGRLVKTLVQSRQVTGVRYEALWDGTNAQGRQMASGTYVSRLVVDGVPTSRFLTLVK